MRDGEVHLVLLGESDREGYDSWDKEVRSEQGEKKEVNGTKEEELDEGTVGRLPTRLVVELERLSTRVLYLL